MVPPDIAGASSGSVARPADGGTQRANDIRVKRAQLKKDLKSGDVSIEQILARPARVRLDGEGLRHADGGAEVRPRQGGAAAQPVPDQPVEDRRRPVRPPAPRADWPLQPLEARSSSLTGPSGAGKGTMVQALLARVPQLAAGGLGDDAAAAARRGRRRRTTGSSPTTEFDRRLAEGDFLEYHVFPWGQRSGTLRSELERIAAAGGVPLLELELNGSLAVRRGMPAPSRSSSTRRSRSSSAGCATGQPRARARSRTGSRSPPSSGSWPASSTTSSRTTTASGLRASACGSSNGDLTACSYHGRR